MLRCSQDYDFVKKKAGGMLRCSRDYFLKKAGGILRCSQDYDIVKLCLLVASETSDLHRRQNASDMPHDE